MITRRQLLALRATSRSVLGSRWRPAPVTSANDVTGNGHWLKVLLQGVQSNRSAIGARVIARYGGRAQAQDVTAQASFYSANDRRLHFGLGAATSADLTGGQMAPPRTSQKWRPISWS